MPNMPMVMPRCGISFADVSLAALECMGNMKRTAKRLGVDQSALRIAVRREGIERWFVSRHGMSAIGSRSRARCVTREQVIDLAADGYSQRDTAYMLGISYSYLKSLVLEWGLRDYFPSHGECVRNGRLGYAR